MTGKLPAAVCPVCLRRVVLRANGALRLHRTRPFRVAVAGILHRRYCTGSGRTPEQTRGAL